MESDARIQKRAAGRRVRHKKKKEEAGRSPLPCRLALFLALILFARTLTRVFAARILAVLMLAGLVRPTLALIRILAALVLAAFARLVGLTLTVFRLVLALTGGLALTLTLFVVALVRVLLAALFIRHFYVS
jgi:hypothetical protein